eukprot:3347456-Amphidinium_carterae.1
MLGLLLAEASASALGWVDPQGVHVIESSFFKYEGLISTTEMHIVHGGTGSALHLIRVPEVSWKCGQDNQRRATYAARSWPPFVSDLGEAARSFRAACAHLSRKPLIRVSPHADSKSFGSAFPKLEPVRFETPQIQLLGLSPLSEK